MALRQQHLVPGTAVVRCRRCKRLLTGAESMRKRMGTQCLKQALDAATLERALRDVPGTETEKASAVAARWKVQKPRTKAERLKYRKIAAEVPRVLRTVEDYTAGLGDLAPYHATLPAKGSPLGADTLRAKRGAIQA
jgi:hypothetical protein